MPIIECLVKAVTLPDFKELLDKHGFDEKLPEEKQREIGRKAASEYQENLHNKLEDLKQSIAPNPKKYKRELYKPPDNSKKIKEVSDKYNKLIEEKKNELSKPPEPPKENTPVKEENKDENKVGVSHKSLTELAKKLGLKEPERGDYIEPHEYAERGRALLKAGATLDDVNNPANDLHDRISIARAHLEDLTDVADKIAKDKGVQSDEYKKATTEIDKYANDTVKKLGTLAHRAFVSLQGERDINTGSFTDVKKAFEKSKGSKATPEQEKKITELTKENETLKQKANEAEKKLVEETDKNIGENDKSEKGNFEKTFKKAADTFRKLKTKPFKFKDSNGKEYDISKSGVSWNDLVELGAKAIEKTGQIADGVAEIIDKIKDTDFYKNLTDKDKEVFKNQLTAHYAGESKSASKLADLQDTFADKSQKDNKFTTDEAKAIWDYAKSEYLEKGVPYRDMISYVSMDTGLTFDQVYNAITTPKTKPIADAMWIKRKNLRKAEVKTKDFVDNANKSLFTKIIETPDKVMRGTAVFGHGGIFVGTHAGMTVFDLPRAKYTIKAFANGYKFAYGNEAAYERSMQKLKSDPNYILAQRAGLQNDPNDTRTDQYQKSQDWLGKIGMGKAGKIFKALGESGIKGFNAIKVLRQDLFNDHYNRLTAAEKADPNTAKSVAELVNNATGGTNIDLKLRDKQGNVVVDPDKVMFAANMEAARWEKLTKNPYKATKTALTALVSDKATPAEKVFAKVWARRVGWELSTYAALSFTNAAIHNYLNPKNPVNLTDPTKPDYLKFKAGGTDINMTSGMLGSIDFIAGLVHNSMMSKNERKGDNVLQADAKNAFSYGRGKLSPFASTLVDLKTGTDFTNNTLPYNSDKPGAGKHQLTWSEYAWQKAPIPVADAAKTMYESMLDNGMNKTQANDYLKGLVSFIEASSTGFRISDSYQKPIAFTDEDKSKPTFKYFIDKGVDLPNPTPPTSIPIKDYKTHTIKNLSDYPKETIDNYNAQHKINFEKSLQQIEKRGYVYVNKFGEISKNYPENSNEIARKKSLDKLSEAELEKVLSIAKSEATTATKDKLFYKSQK